MWCGWIWNRDRCRECDEDISQDCPKDKGYAFFVDINRAVQPIFWDLMSEMLLKQSSLDPFHFHKIASEDNDKASEIDTHWWIHQWTVLDRQLLSARQLAHFARLSRVPSEKRVWLVTFGCMRLSACVGLSMCIHIVTNFLFPSLSPPSQYLIRCFRGRWQCSTATTTLISLSSLDWWMLEGWVWLACVNPFQAVWSKRYPLALLLLLLLFRVARVPGNRWQSSTEVPSGRCAQDGCWGDNRLKKGWHF